MENYYKKILLSLKIKYKTLIVKLKTEDILNKNGK